MHPFFDAFHRHVAGRPDAPALAEDDCTLSYARFDAATDAVAHQLRDAGCAAGEVVPFLGEPGLNRIVVFLGALKAGAVFILLDPGHPEALLRGVADHASAKTVAVDSPAMAALAGRIGLTALHIPAVWPEREAVARFAIDPYDPDRVAYIRYTSGSTGRPKGLAFAWSKVVPAWERMLDVAGSAPEDRYAIFRQFWPVLVLAALQSGAALDFFDLPARGGKALVHWLCDRRITQIRTFAAVYRAMQEEDSIRLPDLKEVVLSGEPLLRADAEYFNAVAMPGARLINCYSATEHQVVSAHAHHAGDPAGFDTMPLGRPTEPEHFWVADGQGMAVARGIEGEFVISSPHGVLAYFNDPEQSAQRFRPFPQLGGRIAYFTGDRGHIDEDGIIHTAGRADDQIKIRGYPVRPSDIEQVLLDHPGIVRAAVVGFDGPKGIRRLACHFVTAGDADTGAADLRAYLGERLPAYMVPTAYRQHESLPTTDTGKILRRVLPDPLSGVADSQRGLTAARSDAERAVVRVWTDVLGHGDFGVQEDFFDAGGDSLQAMAMLTGVEKHFSVRVPLETLILNGATVESIAARFQDAAAAGVAATTAMNRGGPGAPVFAVHVMGGHLSDYLEIASAWDGVRPMIGVRPAGLAGRELPAADIASLGSHAASAVLGHRQQAARGPFRLLGFSAGAVFATAAARALQDEGQAVWLVLLDPPPPQPEKLARVKVVWRGWRDRSPAVAARRLWHIVKAGAGQGVSPGQIDEAHLWALVNRRPEPVTLLRTLIVTSEASDGPARKQAWQALLGGQIDLVERPGDHMAMINGALGRDLAQIIHAWCREHADGPAEAAHRAHA